MINNLGYTKPLFILPFDHRSSFEKIFSTKNDIIAAKWIIYEAFKKAVESGILKQEAAILVDEQFGDKILRDAKRKGFTTLLTTEKSGQKEFDFEYGSKFAKHIEKYQPTFVKALIRYNLEDEEDSKTRQQQKLKILSDYCHNHGHKFLLEVLIEPKESSEQYKGVRPKLAVKVIEEVQNAKVEPDVWKLEGMSDIKDYEAVVNQARSDGRDKVGIVVLGRGENREQVENWVVVGAKVNGVIGFAVGRTVFWQPLVNFKNGKISREKAVETISNNFLHFYRIFNGSKNMTL